jgi:hypothetical protein
VQISPDDLAMDSMTEAFQALGTDNGLQLAYVADAIWIDAVGPSRETGHLGARREAETGSTPPSVDGGSGFVA